MEVKKIIVKELLGFFIKEVFVGVFQYDSGTPKHALELKKVKEKLLKTIQNSEFYLLDLEFQTIKVQFFWAKSRKFQTFYNSKACFGVPESYWNTPTKT